MIHPPDSGVSPQGSSRVGLSPGAETVLLVVIVAVLLAAPLLILLLPAELSPLEADGGDPFSDLSASAVGTALASFALMAWGMLLMLAPARRLSAQRPLPSRAPWGALDVAIVLCPIVALIGLPALLDEPEGS
ncbi:MAG: hypothetical protein O6952_08790, partial [Planctomycetota bacterium]|nr:hypothetical protein [Planctomycetota bacterium]